MSMDGKVVTFGEIMLRLSPPDHQRFLQAESFDAIYGGAEGNVAAALSNLGIPTKFVTRLPENDIGEACLNRIRQYGVDTSEIIWGGDRLGIYYAETGAVHRKSNVIYDRANSALSTIKPDMIDWDVIFSEVDWFHWTGITPAVSEGAADTCLEAVERAKDNNVMISCDLNYRSKLWNWGKTPKEVMTELVDYVDIILGNEEDAEMIFGVEPVGVDVGKGELKAESYRDVAKELMDMFPDAQYVGTTLRESISATRNKWSAVIYTGDELYHSSVYDITDIVDRVGGGDSFAAGLIYGLMKDDKDLEESLNFAVAYSALAHTIYGDFPLIKKEEAEELMVGPGSGRISR